MADSDVQRDLGEFGARIGALESSVHEIREMVIDLTAIVNKAQGGWKMMMLLGGGAAFFGANLHKVSETLKGLFK